MKIENGLVQSRLPIRLPNERNLNYPLEVFKRCGYGGVYLPSHLTRWADEQLPINEGMQEGITLENYADWLRWSYQGYRMKSTDPDKLDNPFSVDSGRLIHELGLEQALWFMSFAQKGFYIQPGRKIEMDEVSLLTKEESIEKYSNNDLSPGITRAGFERELIPDPGGNKVLIERLFAMDRSISPQQFRLYTTSIFYQDKEGRLRVRYEDEDNIRHSEGKVIKEELVLDELLMHKGFIYLDY